jgi:signal peptidase II
VPDTVTTLELPLERQNHLRLGLTWAAIVAVLDQLTKYWLLAYSGVAEGHRMDAGPFVSIVNQRNPGISYSLFEMSGMTGQLVLTAIAVAVSIGIAIWLGRGTNRLTAIALGLVLGGAIGNAIDRPWRGGVIDWVSLHASGFQWYVFNIADVAIVAGVVGLLYESLMGHRKKAANSL